MIVLHVNLFAIRSSVTFVVSTKALDDPTTYVCYGASDCVWIIPGTCNPDEA